MQYAVARIFDSDKLLNNLYTDICFDKFRTAQYIESLGLNTPKTFINYQNPNRRQNSIYS